MNDIIAKYLSDLGANSILADVGSWIILCVVVGLFGILANFVTKKMILRAVEFAVRKTKTDWDDTLIERQFFARLSHIAPAMVIYFAAPLFAQAQMYLQKASYIYMLIVGLSVIDAFLNAVNDIYSKTKVARSKPIKGYVQVVKIFVFIFGSILAIATAIDKSPWGLLSGLGAMTAVIMLVFKDSILGFVASVQISAYDIVRQGDWITIPKLGVDGDVIDVSLNTVKIRSFDKTLITLPTFVLVQEPVQNWRGMSESGGRRIKRSISIDIGSIRFCDDALLDRLKKIQALKPYIEQKEADIVSYNKEHGIDATTPVNGRKLTNIGCFRAYVVEYLKKHPKIHKDFTFLVRQLAPTESGVPIELYVFANDNAWVNYEAIQSDIFDHLLAAVPEFDLRVFQNPTGADFQSSFRRAA